MAFRGFPQITYGFKVPQGIILFQSENEAADSSSSIINAVFHLWHVDAFKRSQNQVPAQARPGP